MSGCDFDTLEALAFDELTPLLAAEARAHVAGCTACARELSLLRAERGVFAARAKASPPLPGFSAVLARSRSRGPAAASAGAPRAKSGFSWAVSAFGVAAAAAFAGLFLLPPGASKGIEPSVAEPVVVEPASEDFCRDEASASGFTSPPRSPTVCEMPASAAAHAAPEGDPHDCGGCAPGVAEDIHSCSDDSCVTEACYSPTHD